MKNDRLGLEYPTWWEKRATGGEKFSTILVKKDTQGNFMKLLRELFGKFFILPARIT